MKSKSFMLALLPLSTLAFNPFRAPQQVVTASSSPYTSQPTGITGEFNPIELLGSNSRKPDLFNKAMVELKQLESEPICHRVAARLLVNNCRGLEQLNEHNYQFNSNEAQRHHVDSFTISLTTCELERMALLVPGECSLFTSSALFQYARDGRKALEVSPGQVNECLRALAQDQSSLQTWISYRDKALLFCQAARLDLDKDQAIRLHQKLTEIMEDFLADTNGYMKIMKMNMEDSARAADSFFKKAMNDAENWGAKVQESFRSVSDGVKDIDSAMRSVLSRSNDITQMMTSFMKTVLEGTASIANEHERALDVTSNRFETRMVGIHDMVADTEVKLAEMRALVVEAVGPMIVSLAERQEELDKKTQNVLSAVINATELLQSHNQKLDQASSKALVITDDLEKAAAAAKLWSETLRTDRWLGWLADWGIRCTSGVLFAVAGNINVPTLNPVTLLARSIVLFFGGFATGEGIIQIRHFWTSSWVDGYFSSPEFFNSYTSEPYTSIVEYPSMVSESFGARQTVHVDME